MAETSNKSDHSMAYKVQENFEKVELSSRGMDKKSKKSICSVSEYRYSIVSGMEAYIRWSLGRAQLWPEHAYSFMVITVTHKSVHLSVTEVNSGVFETHQWLFSSEARLAEVVATISVMVDLSSCRYIFMPSRMRALPFEHLGASMTRKALLPFFPDAKLIHLNGIGRISPRIMVRRIGADVHRYVETQENQMVMSWYDYSNEKDALTSAVESDSAALLKLIATPVHAYLQKTAA